MPRWTLLRINKIPRLQRCDDLLAIRHLKKKQPGIDTVTIANLLPLAYYGIYQWMSELNGPQLTQMTYSVTSVLVDGHYLSLASNCSMAASSEPQIPDNNARRTSLINVSQASCLQQIIHASCYSYAGLMIARNFVSNLWCICRCAITGHD